MANTLSNIKGCLIDLDGTVYFKGAVIPGVREAIERLREMKLRIRFLTNIDSQTNETISANLRGMGLDIDPSEIFSAVGAAHEFIRQKGNVSCCCLVSRELQPSFMPYVHWRQSVEYVVVGDLRDSLSYDDINTAFRFLMMGARLVALQKGKYFVREDGAYIDTGGFIALLEYCSGQEAILVGKPSETFFRLGMDQIGCRPDEVLVIGDDVTTDIRGATAVGATAVLVRTGKFSGEALRTSDVQPDIVIESIADLPNLLNEDLS